MLPEVHCSCLPEEVLAADTPGASPAPDGRPALSSAAWISSCTAERTAESRPTASVGVAVERVVPAERVEAAVTLDPPAPVTTVVPLELAAATAGRSEEGRLMVRIVSVSSD